VRAYAVPTHGQRGSSLDVGDAWRVASGTERLLLLIALALSATAAYASVCGLLVLFPLQPTFLVTPTSLAEAAKFVGIGVLAAGWGKYGFLPKVVVSVLMLTCATINAAGVYGTLIEDHVNVAAHGDATFTAGDADTGARLDMASGKVAEIDRRLRTLDGVRKLSRDQKRERDQLVAQRDAAAADEARFKSSRAAGAARHEAPTSLPICPSVTRPCSLKTLAS
jgi:hypothetical protein